MSTPESTKINDNSTADQHQELSAATDGGSPGVPSTNKLANSLLADVFARLQMRISELEAMDVASTTTVPNIAEGSQNAPPSSPAAGCSEFHAAQSTSDVGQGGSNAISGIVCPTCNNIVNFSAPDSRWYTIYVGRMVGWIRGHGRAIELTRAISGQGFRYSPTGEQGARVYYHQKQQAGQVRVVNDGATYNMVYGIDEGALFA
ncbi:hypothetical protein AAF712_015173 [Marasmius tenuissimus]|uniref:Uncharacterized protein n=1 Tax=Marasmius tenuissimus TaxID=585030 RepID=A0ABR2Z994_9AGAR